MTHEEIFAALSEKVTERDTIESLFRKSEYNIRAGTMEMLGYFKRSDNVSWDKREAMRIKYRVYKTSTVLDALNRVVPVYAHISTEDKTLVAYTLDRQAGEADRQLRSSIGKLLQRAYPCLDEDTVRDMIETHQSEVNPNVVFVEGKGIAEVYMEEGGLSSCMTPKEGSRAWTIDTIPALAYDAPGIRLATIRSSTGKLMARCLVVELDGKKQYIRNYGSPVLQKWLENNGYVPGGWVGVKFNTVKMPDSQNKYLMPYLDAMGGIAKNDHCTVALVDGVITGVSPRFRSYLAQEGIPYGCPSSSGCIQLSYSVDIKDISRICALSGQSYIPYEVETARYRLNGEIVEVLRSAMPEEGCRLLRDGTWADTADCIRIEGSYYLNKPEVIEAAGYTKLNPELYPENQEWQSSYYFYRSIDGMILKRDGVSYIKDGVSVLRHKAKIDKTDVRLANLSGEKVYAAAGEVFYRTSTNAKVHPKVHNIVQMWDGKWEFSRGKKYETVLGEGYWMYKLSDRQQIRAEKWREILDKAVDQWAKGDWSFNRAVLRAVRGTGLRENYIYNVKDTPLANLPCRNTYTSLSRSELSDASISQILYVVENGCDDRASGEKAYVVRWLKEMLAEMEAVEAPHYLAPYTEPTPEISIIQAVSEETQTLPEAMQEKVATGTGVAIYPVNETETQF